MGGAWMGFSLFPRGFWVSVQESSLDLFNYGKLLGISPGSSASPRTDHCFFPQSCLPTNLCNHCIRPAHCLSLHPQAWGSSADESQTHTLEDQGVFPREQQCRETLRAILHLQSPETASSALPLGYVALVLLCSFLTNAK